MVLQLCAEDAVCVFFFFFCSIVNMAQTLLNVTNGCKPIFLHTMQDQWKEASVAQTFTQIEFPIYVYPVSDQVEGLSVEDGKRQTRGMQSMKYGMHKSPQQTLHSGQVPTNQGFLIKQGFNQGVLSRGSNSFNSRPFHVRKGFGGWGFQLSGGFNQGFQLGVLTNQEFQPLV